MSLITSVAAAQEPELTAQVGLATEYTGKGLGKSDGQAAWSGSVRWQRSGAYVSAFVSEAASGKGADAETILTAGYARDVAGFGIDAQVMYRDMRGEVAGYDSGYWEYQADLERDLGARAGLRLRVNYSPDGYGPAGEAWWVELQGSARLTAADKLTAAYAQRRVDVGADYDAWNIGVKHKFTPSLSGDLRWYDTDGHEFGERYEGRLVAAVIYNF